MFAKPAKPTSITRSSTVPIRIFNGRSRVCPSEVLLEPKQIIKNVNFSVVYESVYTEPKITITFTSLGNMYQAMADEIIRQFNLIVENYQQLYYDQYTVIIFGVIHNNCMTIRSHTITGLDYGCPFIVTFVDIVNKILAPIVCGVIQLPITFECDCHTEKYLTRPTDIYLQEQLRNIFVRRIIYMMELSNVRYTQYNMLKSYCMNGISSRPDLIDQLSKLNNSELMTMTLLKIFYYLKQDEEISKNLIFHYVGSNITFEADELHYSTTSEVHEKIRYAGIQLFKYYPAHMSAVFCQLMQSYDESIRMLCATSLEMYNTLLDDSKQYYECYNEIQYCIDSSWWVDCYTIEEEKD